MKDKLADLARRAVSSLAHSHRQTSASTSISSSCFRYYSSVTTTSPPPNNKLFVGGLSLSVDEKSLLDAFSSYGEVTEGVVSSGLFRKALQAVQNHVISEALTRTVEKEHEKDSAEQVRILYDKETGRSRGFGFVHFSKEDEATCARDAMDGKAFFGRPLRITFALDKVRGAPVVVPRVRNSENAPVPERLNSFKSV